MESFAMVLPDDLTGFTIDETVRFARRADEAGVHSLWKGEASGSNGFMYLAAIARATDDVELATGVANVYSRSPTVLAMSAATLDVLSGGRTILGLGVSSPPVVERWHGLDYDRPLRRLRETIEIVDDIVDDGHVDYDGEIFDVGPYSFGLETVRDSIPTYNAALGEANRSLTAEFADGWVPIFLPFSKLEEYVTELSATATAADRDMPTVAPWIPTAVDTDRDHARRRVKELMAHEMAMGYNRLMHQHGFGAEADAAYERWHDGDRDAAAEAISDEMADEFGVYGAAAECHERLDTYRDAGVDVPVLWPAFTASNDEVFGMLDSLTA